MFGTGGLRYQLFWPIVGPRIPIGSTVPRVACRARLVLRGIDLGVH